MRRLRPNVITLALGLTLAVAAQAKTTDRNAPMDISADKTDAVLTDDSDSTLTGNVLITQGSMQITADRAVIHRRGGEITEVELTGAPATLKQVADNGEPMNARAGRIVYTLSADVVVLTSSVVIEQPRGNLRGETIKYDLKTGRLDGGGDGSRVQMRILPKSAGAAPAN
jgi:lipopolysaccharide export system protein LptA